MTEQKRCESCGRAILWAISPTGARLPLDARPMTAYTLDDAALGDRHALKLETSQPLYVSHFTTCPNAARHSRPRR